MDKLLNKTGKYYIIVFVVFLAAASFISPLADDFIYYVAPNPNFTLSDLLPEPSFWRPFDVLIGALNGVFPSLFPKLNFTLVIFGHVMSAYLIEKILTKKEIENQIKNLSPCCTDLNTLVKGIIFSNEIYINGYEATKKKYQNTLRRAE